VADGATVFTGAGAPPRRRTVSSNVPALMMQPPGSNTKGPNHNRPYPVRCLP
jgi:hypothetical protein